MPAIQNADLYYIAETICHVFIDAHEKCGVAVAEAAAKQALASHNSVEAFGILCEINKVATAYYNQKPPMAKECNLLIGHCDSDFSLRKLAKEYIIEQLNREALYQQASTLLHHNKARSYNRAIDHYLIAEVMKSLVMLKSGV